MIHRLLKINKVDGFKIYCNFSSGEYRVIDLSKFVKEYDLSNDDTLKEIMSGDSVNVVVKNGTLTFPDIVKKISLKSGKEFEVEFDLDPIMLYDISEADEKSNSIYQIGNQLRNARKQAGLTQEELADRVGTSKSYISRIENNRTDIALKTLRRIVEIGLEKRLMIAD